VAGYVIVCQSGAEEVWQVHVLMVTDAVHALVLAPPPTPLLLLLLLLPCQVPCARGADECHVLPAP
jgi:hypothetical protein